VIIVINNRIYNFKRIIDSYDFCHNRAALIIISNYVHTGCNKCLVYNGFYWFCLIVPGHASQYVKGRNISVTRLRYSANHIALDSWPIRAHLTFQRGSFVKIEVFQKAGHKGETIMYSIWKIMCFLNFKPHKHIALHQIHKIMFFLAASYDPFKNSQ